MIETPDLSLTTLKNWLTRFQAYVHLFFNWAKYNLNQNNCSASIVHRSVASLQDIKPGPTGISVSFFSSQKAIIIIIIIIIIISSTVFVATILQLNLTLKT